MIEAVGSDRQFWAEDFWSRFYSTNIEDELMVGMKAHGTCRASDGEYVCSLDVGHPQQHHIDLRDRFVTFAVPRVVN